MHYRAWIVAAALGLVFLGAPAWSQEPGKPELEGEPVAAPRQAHATSPEAGSGESGPSGSSEVAPALERIESAIRALKAKPDDEQSERQEDREIRDLRAQQDMAVWAERMFWATAATVVLTAVALAAILRTLHHTRRAADAAFDMVDEAKDATAAARATATHAQQQLEFSEKLGRIESAAYLKFKSGSIVRRAYVIEISILVENIGKSPTIVAEIDGLFVRALPREGDAIFFSGRVISDGISLAPGGEEVVRALVEPESNTGSDGLFGALSENLVLQVGVNIHWRDALGSSHAMEFQLRGVVDETTGSLDDNPASMSVVRSGYRYLGYKVDKDD